MSQEGNPLSPLRTVSITLSCLFMTGMLTAVMLVNDGGHVMAMMVCFHGQYWVHQHCFYVSNFIDGFH